MLGPSFACFPVELRCFVVSFDLEIRPLSTSLTKWPPFLEVYFLGISIAEKVANMHVTKCQCDSRCFSQGDSKTPVRAALIYFLCGYTVLPRSCLVPILLKLCTRIVSGARVIQATAPH